MGILNHIINIIFPAVCKQCSGPISSDTPTAYFCNNCWDGIKWFDGPVCPQCGIPYTTLESPSNPPQTYYGHICGDCSKDPPYFDRAISAGPYEGVLAEAIKLFKYKKKVHIGRALTDWMITSTAFASTINHSFPLWGEGKGEGVTCIIPVPLHMKRLREREFNQSVIIASELGAKLGIPVVADVLIRQLHTKPQVGLDIKERKKNVSGVFAVRNGEIIKDKEIILVDDVYTTGSTVNECAMVLKKKGTGRVYVITIARMAR